MVKPADLAGRADFRIGPLFVSPSRRRIEGPAGTIQVEPVTMQVFLLLLDAAGRVVTRDELFEAGWGGAMVGDDSLNRAINRVRKIAAETGPGLFEIETITRTGYRITGESLNLAEQVPGVRPRKAAVSGAMSRRFLIGGAAAVGIAGTAWLWRANRPQPNARFDALMARGDEAFRNGDALSGVPNKNSSAMLALYGEAVKLQPESARAWGLLGYFRSALAEEATAEEMPSLVADAQAAIGRALELDPNEPNARVALFLFEGRMLDWTARDRRLRAILETDPNNILAMSELMAVLQATGLTRESWMWNERILRASPLARPFLVVRSLKLWIMGRTREADNVIDRVRGLWPNDWFGNYARFIIFAMTGRPRAASAMLDSAPKIMTEFFKEPSFRAALKGLETRAPADIEAARRACVEAARRNPAWVNDIIMFLCALGLKDAAFEVTDGFLLWRGTIVSTNQANGKEMDDYSRRMTQWLFTPPVAIMRADPRFRKLCDEFGLTDYWRARNVRPDYQVYG